MATTPMQRSTMANLLKRRYSPERIKRVFNRKRVLYNKINAGPQQLNQGLEFWYAVHTGRSGTGGHVPEAGAIPDTSPQTTDWLKFNMATYLHPIAYTGQYKYSARGREAASASELEFMVNSALQDSGDNMAIAMYTPANGQKSLIKENTTTAATTTSFDVENPRRFSVGEYIVVALAATPATVTEGIGGTGVALGTDFTKITNIVGTRITVSDALTGVAWTFDNYGRADYAVFNFYDWKADQTGDSGATPSGKYPGKVFGLEDIINDTNPIGTNVSNYGQVNRSTAGNTWAQGHIMDIKGAGIDHDMAEEACELVSVNTNAEIDFWVGDYKIYREIKKLHYGDKRATYKEKMGNNWFPYAMLADKPFFPDRFAGAGDIFGISQDNIKIKENLPFQWVDDDQMWARIPNQWAFEALGARMWQICATPNSHVRIKNVASTSFSTNS